MADYVAIQNENLEPGAPWISATAFALRDNPVAIAEGASGAPRVVNAAVASGTLGAEKFQTGSTERDWVLARIASLSINSVGSYRMAYYRSSTQLDLGGTASGSSLRARPGVGIDSFSASAANNLGDSLPGTWRLMGHHGVQADLSGGSSPMPAAFWLRIS